MWLRGKKEQESAPKHQKSIHIADRVASAIFQEILKDNGIRWKSSAHFLLIWKKKQACSTLKQGGTSLF